VSKITAWLLRVSTINRSVHFYPAVKVIFSLPVSLYRHNLQQHAGRVSGSESQQKSLSKFSNTPHKYAAATFVPREYIQSGPVNVYIVVADNRGRRGWAWQICWDGCL